MKGIGNDHAGPVPAVPCSFRGLRCRPPKTTSFRPPWTRTSLPTGPIALTQVADCCSETEPGGKAAKKRHFVAAVGRGRGDAGDGVRHPAADRPDWSATPASGCPAGLRPNCGSSVQVVVKTVQVF